MGEPTTASSSPANAPRSRRLGCQIVLLAAIAFLVAGSVTAYWLWKSVPSDWVSNQAYLNSLDNAAKLQIAEAVRNRVVAEATDIAQPGSPGQPYLNQERTIHLTFQEINVWLADELPTWNESMNLKLPPQIKDYMLSPAGENLVLRARYDTPELNQIISVEFGIDFFDDGSARLRLEGVRGGLLPVPLGPILNQVRKSASGDERAKGIKGLIDFLGGESFSPIAKLDSTRQLRLIGYHITGDGIDLHVKTEMKNPS